MKKNFSVQVTCKKEVCVFAEDEGEAEEIAREADIDWIMGNVEADAEEMYNDPDDAECVEQFKEQQEYFTA